MYLFIGISKADYEETDWVRTIAKNEEEARKNIINDFAKWDEISKEEAEEIYTIENLTQIDEIDGYKITITKI